MTTTIATPDLLQVLDERTVALIEKRRSARAPHRRGWLIRRALLAADLIGLMAAFAVAELLYPASQGRPGALTRVPETAAFMLFLPAWVVAAKLYGLYDKDEERTDHSTVDDFAGVFHLVTVSSWLLYAVSLTTRWFDPQFGKVFLFWLLATAGIPAARFTARALCRRSVNYLQNTLIVGAGHVGQTLARKLLKHPEYGLNLVGFVDPIPMERADGLEHLTVLGDSHDILGLVEMLDVERVIYAFSRDRHELSLSQIRSLNDMGVQVDVVPRFFEVLGPVPDVHSVEGIPLWGLPPSNLARSSKVIKRAVDLTGALVGLLLLSPLLIAVAFAITVESRGGVFFRQTRMGAAGTTFRIWKFRTMTADADRQKHHLEHLNKHLRPGGDARMFKIDDDPRVTRVGRVLRRLSLDELPQLINVLHGQMSLVGPRPIILSEHRHVTDWGIRRLDLKPGITGLWQVLGRDEIGFEEMVRLDYLYVTNWSLLGDLHLVFRTIPAVLRRPNRA